MTQTLAYKSVLPTAPRDLTRRAASRAWAELPVQLWWKCAAVVLVVSIAVGFTEGRKALRDRWLMEKGVPVKATIVEVKQTSRANYAVLRDDNVPVKLRWTSPATAGGAGSPTGAGGARGAGSPTGSGNQNDPAGAAGAANSAAAAEQTVDVILPPAPGYAKVGEALNIRVDPANPANWMEAKELLPWWRVLAIPLILLLPIAALLLAVAWWQRRQVLKVWRDGRRADGVVVDSKHAAMSPASRVCRFTYADSRDRRVYKLLFPSSHGVPKKGDPLQLIALPDAPHRALATELYLTPGAAQPLGAADPSPPP